MALYSSMEQPPAPSLSLEAAKSVFEGVEWPKRCIETGCDNPRESGWEEGFNKCHSLFMSKINEIEGKR